jgi:hypothetical protein
MNPFFRSSIAFLACFFIVATAFGFAPARNYYQLKIYHYKTTAQENTIEKYLQQAYIPALHRAGVKNVGVFKPVTQVDTAKLLYVFTPFQSWDKLMGIDQKLPMPHTLPMERSILMLHITSSLIPVWKQLYYRPSRGCLQQQFQTLQLTKPTGFTNCAVMKVLPKSTM